LALDVPTKGSILSPEVYEREKKKFEEMMDETRNMAAITLREEFADIIAGLVDKLNSNSGQPKTIKSSMFNSLHEFINDLTTKNIFDDKKLMELAKIAKDSISGISPYGLNYNDQMKNKIKVSMKTLNDAINDSIEELPKRKIRLALAA
jgi:DNA helicase TIP49 (TBP-interacting protein)